jgi:hypothetical protein
MFMDAALRAQVRERAANVCEYCHLPQVFAPFPIFHIEHIRARKHGGATEQSNLCLACSFCNLHKSSNLSGIDPETDEIVRLFHPRTDLWDEHFEFRWPPIIGRTAIGRVTVAVLDMNDDERLELRKELGGESVALH